MATITTENAIQQQETTTSSSTTTTTTINESPNKISKNEQQGENGNREDEEEYIPEVGVDDEVVDENKQSTTPTKNEQKIEMDPLEIIKQRKLVGQLQAIVDKAGFFCK